MNLLDHRNLPELLEFVPALRQLSVDGDYVVCHLAAPLAPEATEILKLRFGFQPGIVTPTTVRIHKSYLLK